MELCFADGWRYRRRSVPTKTNLTGANLTRADLRFANLEGAVLTDANLDRVWGIR
jgi:uncharacterized protein YjbI with pentapeptide repeats